MVLANPLTDPLTTPCTCGHPASAHNALGACYAPKEPDSTLGCPCSDFTSDDTAIAQAAGVLVTEVTRPDGTTRLEHVGLDG